VYVDENWLTKVNRFGETAEDMLDVLDEREDNSRLSCQIKITEVLDGLIVTTPESQF
jgi:2Fe-2S ferredoxin